MKGIFQNKVNDKRLETSGKKDQNGKKKKKSNIVDYIFWWFLKTFLMVETEIIILSDVVSACSSNIKENHT